MVISTIEDLNALFEALNRDFRASRITFSEYVDGLQDLKQAATVAELPFVFSATDLVRSINYREVEQQPIAPYFVSLDELDAEPSEEEASSDLFDDDSSEGWDDDELDEEAEKKHEIE